MTQVFAKDGRVIPVTRVQAGPCVVTQVKKKDNHSSSAVQIGYGEQKMFRHAKPQRGHLNGLEAVRVMRDVPVENDDHGLNRGDIFSVEIFAQGDKVQVTGTSKGKGFQGVVKRHNFAGSPKTHGHKDQHRMPGSIGATGPARVFKGTRMGGHMGDAQVSVLNLEVVEVDEEKNELLIKGALPGARNSLVLIVSKEGKIEIKKPVVEEKTPAEKKEDPSANAQGKKEVKSEAPKETEENKDAATEENAESTTTEAPKAANEKSE